MNLQKGSDTWDTKQANIQIPEVTSTGLFSSLTNHLQGNYSQNYLICIKDVEDIGSKLFRTSVRKELLVDSFKFLQ